MNNIPSKSISKSLLIATPLFLIIMAVLNTSNEISYLFVLDFVNNVGGKADVIFLPTLQPEIHSDNIYRDLVLMNSGISQNSTTFLEKVKIPLINMSDIHQWKNKNQIVKGAAPRWLFPIVTQNSIDSLMMVMNISLQNEIGSSQQANLQPLTENEVAIPQELFNRLNIDVGSTIKVNFAIKNLFNGMKLIQKFQDPTSADQFSVQQPELNLSFISQRLYEELDKQINISTKMALNEFKKAVITIYETELVKEYKVKYVYKENGLYPSALHNVVILQYKALATLLWQFIKDKIILNKSVDINQILPQQYLALFSLFSKSSAFDNQSIKQLQNLLQDYCILAVSLFHKRQLIYHPQQPLKQLFSKTLESPPNNVEVVAIYPFYQQSLNIKYFFASIIQIFEAVTCVIYFFTISLIMKQIYEEKQIQVGIWRTLGAGGVKQNHHQTHQQLNETQKNQIEFQYNSLPPVYKLNQKLSLRQKAFYYLNVMTKIGFLYYWLISSLISISIYIILKHLFIKSACQLLHFDVISQNLGSAFWLFWGVFGLTQTLIIKHIRKIYISPLSLTIKPTKRTFDDVKVRIIHVATFGVSSSTLLIAVMLIYYGVVSYYWIPFSILDNDGDLQVTLFDSIFIFMIFGAIILIAVLQTKLERLIIRGFCALNKRLDRLKSVMLKNIKAKQYKNIKMSIIIAVTFAFLLFFSTGINAQIMIVKSLIQRQLGAQLVLQNYQKKSFDKQKVESYLDSISNIKYSWISSDINSDGIQIELINQMDPLRKIFCQWKVMTPNYLDSAIYKYYYPQDYIRDNMSQYRVLPNGVYNGFDSIYKYDGIYNNKSIGKFNPQDTMTEYDPYRINIGTESIVRNDIQMAPQEQVINFAASSILKIQMGSNIGDLYKLKIASNSSVFYLRIRSKIVHTYKVGPGMDLLRPQAFITEEQAKYLLKVLGQNQTVRYQKLLISAPQDQIRQIGNKILSISPQHTEMYEMKIVSQSFELLQKYLSYYIILIATIMGTLAVLFVFIYTIGKCKDQAEMHKILRAIGVSVIDLRIMIFFQIFIRLFVSIMNGILLGIVFSLGFSKQIQEFLMINTPGMDLTLIMSIAWILLTVFCATVYMATKYLTKKTVADTTKN